MIQFLYSLGTVVFNVFTLWLAMLGALVLWDVAYSKLRSKKRRRRLNSLSDDLVAASVLTVFAFIAAAIDLYLLTPALGAGINFFFVG